MKRVIQLVREREIFKQWSLEEQLIAARAGSRNSPDPIVKNLPTYVAVWMAADQYHYGQVNIEPLQWEMCKRYQIPYEEWCFILRQLALLGIVTDVDMLQGTCKVDISALELPEDILTSSPDTRKDFNTIPKDVLAKEREPIDRVITHNDIRCTTTGIMLMALCGVDINSEDQIDNFRALHPNALETANNKS